jgi:periplasmic copper chaperone A
MQLPLPSCRDAGPGADRQRRRVLLPCVLALVAAMSAGAAARADEPGLSVSAPWMRLVMPSRPAAGYFTVENKTAKATALTGAKSPACGSLMLHRSVQQNGTDRMIMVSSVPVPAHGAVTFAPGGYHLMCMSPSAAVRPGKSVPVTLRFEDGGTLTTNFPVRGATGR